MGNVIIIAEAGVNHNGSIHVAKELIDVAAAAGADFVKFQTFKANKIASRFASAAKYQKANTGADHQITFLQKLELSEHDHKELITHANKKGIQFLSTPFDLDSIDLLMRLGIRLGKIPSGEITNLPYLQKMAASFDKLILSTGMSGLEEVAAAVDVILSTGFRRDHLTILHCNTEYPTPFEDVNLRAMQTLADAFNVRVGYSDHTVGIEVPVAAVALGAVVIEKHFTLNRKMEGPDHKASLEPDELAAMVKSIRNIELALGNKDKVASASEIKNKDVARKSIVAARNIEAGETLSEENLAVKRPGNGISPMLWNKVIGQKAKRRFEADELIEI